MYFSLKSYIQTDENLLLPFSVLYSGERKKPSCYDVDNYMVSKTLTQHNPPPTTEPVTFGVAPIAGCLLDAFGRTPLAGRLYQDPVSGHHWQDAFGRTSLAECLLQDTFGRMPFAGHLWQNVFGRTPLAGRHLKDTIGRIP